MVLSRPKNGLLLEGESRLAVMTSPNPDRVAWSRTLPFLMMHLACLPVLWCGVSKLAVSMFQLPHSHVWNHRRIPSLFCTHRSFKTSRGFQFVLGMVGGLLGPLGPLWWAAHHRHHHQHSDTEKDAHTPGLKGFLWSGTSAQSLLQNTMSLTTTGCVTSPPLGSCASWKAGNWLLPPTLLAVSTLAWGWWLGRFAPEWGTNGLQLLTWGFFVSTFLVYHATFCINSLAHLWGSRRYPTRDDSRDDSWTSP